MPTQPAILGSARLNNFRLGYVSAALQPAREWRLGFMLDGESVRHRVRVGSVEIRDVLNDAPNTASWRMDGTPPPEPGMVVRITVNADTPRLLFNGTLETTELRYEGKPTQIVYACTAIDDTTRADRRRPFGLYQNVSASTVATDLVARFAPGMTAAHVQLGLAPVTVAFDGTEGFNGCLRAITKIIGGYFYWEDGDLHLFTEEATAAPDPLTPATPTLYHEPPIAATTDESQLRTRVYGRGYGTTLLSDVLATETILPLANAALFTLGGGKAIASVTADGSPTEILTYAGATPGGAGMLVGPAVSPNVKPAPVAIQGAGLGSGAYQYAYTFVTASGETIPGPVDTITTGAPVPGPTAPLTGGYSNAGGGPYPFAVGDTVRYWAYTFTTVAGETLSTPAWFPLTAYPLGPGGPYLCGITIPTGPAGTTGRKLYRTAMGSSQFKLVATLADNTTTTYFDRTFDAALGANMPTTNTAGTLNAASIAGIALGPAGTTQRKVYRTVVNGAALKLQQTIANNTATTGVIDTTADGALGAAAPATDTSGLTLVTGQVTPGSTSILTTGPGALPTAGWMLSSGSELLRYTGISGNTLTGVPASGPGAILTTLLYGDQLRPAPTLTGVSGLTAPLAKGARVHVFVQRDDYEAQVAAAARESTPTYTADGIHEHMLTDERRAEPSLTSLCDADLQLFAYPLVTVQYVSADIKTKSGKPITIALPSPAIDETLVIQDVTISQLDLADGVPARFATTASNTKFSLEDLLRRMSALLPE